MAEDRISGGDEEFDKEFAAEQPPTPEVPVVPESDAPPASDKKEEEGTEEDPVDLVVPIRKSTAQHIIARKNRTIEKLRSQDDALEDTPPPSDDDEPVDDTPPTESALAREVAAQLKPVIDTFISSTDEAELKELLSSAPDAQKYEKRIRAYMKDPHWKAIPPSAIYHHLAFDHATGVTQKQEKKKIADIEAGQVQGGGSQHRETAPTGDIPTVEDMDNMDDAEFEAVQNKARSGGFVTR